MQMRTPATLRTVFEDYKLSRELKPVTIRNYNQRLNQYLADWLDIPIAEISREMVQQRHSEIAKPAMANSTMRTLRALFIYAAATYSDLAGGPIITTKPVSRLSEMQSWNRDQIRRDVIAANELKNWFRGVYSVDSTTLRDFMLILLLTGLRKGQIMKLRWEQVDLERGLLRVDDQSVPVSDFVLGLLTARKTGSRSEWVFSSQVADKPISAGTNSMNFVIERTGIEFSLHTLRRTFATIADDLEIKSSILKDLMLLRTDYTTGSYTERSVEIQRKATQQITDCILGYAEMKK